jgi:peptidoglycan/LPS O-acetylase OafA/YrhL
MINKEPRFFLTGLDGWRAVSILLVIFSHLASQQNEGLFFQLGEFLTRLKIDHHSFGRKGVQIFFCISGYLIFSRILIEIKKYNDFSIKEFFIRRCFRIFPPMYFFLGFYFIMALLGYGVSMKETLSSMVFGRVWFPLDNTGWSWYTAHIWSLCMEEYFYIVLSFCAAFFSLTFIKISSLFLFVSMIIFNLAIWRVPELRNFEYQYFLKDFVEFRFMAIGVLFAFLKNSTHLINKIIYKYQGLFVFLMLVFILFRVPFSTIAFPIVVALAIHSTSNGLNYVNEIILENKILVFIGTISYSLYLWQQFWIPWFDAHIDGIKFLQYPPFNIVMILITSIFSFYIIEKPMIKIGRKYVQRRF